MTSIKANELVPGQYYVVERENSTDEEGKWCPKPKTIDNYEIF